MRTLFVTMLLFAAVSGKRGGRGRGGDQVSRGSERAEEVRGRGRGRPEESRGRGRGRGRPEESRGRGRGRGRPEESRGRGRGRGRPEESRGSGRVNRMNKLFCSAEAGAMEMDFMLMSKNKPRNPNKIMGEVSGFTAGATFDAFLVDACGSALADGQLAEL